MLPPVPTLVDDHCLLVAKLANLLFEFAQAGRVHRLNMKVSDASARQLINLLATFFHPTLVAKVRIRGRVDGFNASFPGAFGGGFVVESNFHFAIEAIVQQLPIFIPGLHFFAADGN
jgi:hypothetical protein